LYTGEFTVAAEALMDIWKLADQFMLQAIMKVILDHFNDSAYVLGATPLPPSSLIFF